MGRKENIRAIVFAARQMDGRISTSQAQWALGTNITDARLALAEAVELGFLSSAKEFQREAVFEYTGKSLSELEEPSTGLLAQFDELLSAWNIPMLAPVGRRGRVHVAFS